MDDNYKYLLDDDQNVPPSPPVNVLHLHVKYAKSDPAGARGPSQENMSEHASEMRLQDDREYIELEEEDMEAESPLMSEEEQSLSFVKYGRAYPAPKPRDIHLDFKHSEMFQVHKAQKDFTYMKQHDTIRCSELPWTDVEVADLLDIIRPPLEFHDKDNNRWHRRMSSEVVPCNASEELHKTLDVVLEQRQARRSGICPVRRAIYDDCFDELHRQITLDCPERGVLLQRCRLEIAHTFDVMVQLFGSSFAYIMRQTAMDTGATKDTEKQVQIAREQKDQLAKVYKNLLQRAEGEEDRLETEKLQEKERMDNELEYLKVTEGRLRNVLNRFMNLHTALKEVAVMKNKTEAAGGGEGKGDG